MNRRHFLTSSAVTAASYQRILGANDRVCVGFIGLGNRGDQVLDAFLEHGDQEVAALGVLRDDYMDFAHKKSRANPSHYKDYRKLLAHRDLDAVAIATPDHWHALMCVDACNAGKDVYVEKPLSLTVVEGRRMVEAVRRNKRVSQVGVQRRSSPFCRRSRRTRPFGLDRPRRHEDRDRQDAPRAVHHHTGGCRRQQRDLEDSLGEHRGHCSHHGALI